MTVMKKRIVAVGIVGLLTLAGWGWHALNDWVRHGWWRYYPICFSGELPLEELVNPMKPKAREYVYAELEKRFPGGTRRDGDVMYIRPYIALFQIPERQNFLSYMIEDIGGPGTRVTSLCSGYLRIFTNNTREITEPLPPEWLIDIMQFLTFYPRLD